MSSRHVTCSTVTAGHQDSQLSDIQTMNEKDIMARTMYMLCVINLITKFRNLIIQGFLAKVTLLVAKIHFLFCHIVVAVVVIINCTAI